MRQDKNRQVQAQMSQIWTEIVEHLTLRQLDRCMGGDMSYKSKALRAMQASKSQAVQDLGQDLISLYESHFETPVLQAVDSMGFDLSDFE